MRGPRISRLTPLIRATGQYQRNCAMTCQSSLPAKAGNPVTTAVSDMTATGCPAFRGIGDLAGPAAGPAAVENDPKETGRAAQDHSGLAWENFTTLLNFSVSSTMSLPKSAAEPGSAVAPKSANRAFILGSTSAALISMLSLSTISAGVFFGAPTPVQKLAS